jgi:hypothetical protein
MRPKQHAPKPDEVEEQPDREYTSSSDSDESMEQEQEGQQEEEEGEELEEELEEEPEEREDNRVGNARKKDTEALPNAKKTRQLPIQPKRMVKKQQPPTSTASRSSSSKPSPTQTQSKKKGKKRKQPVNSLLRVAWNDTMCEILLYELVRLVRKGKVSAKGFKEAIWEDVAEKVRPYYTGNAPFTGKKCKSKYEGYKGIWSAWCTHLGHLSGWTARDSDGLPIAARDEMEQHFQEYPSCEQFREEVPTHFDYVSEIFGDRLATGKSAHGPDSMGEDEIEFSDEEQDEEQEEEEAEAEGLVDDRPVTPLAEKEPSPPARSISTPSHSEGMITSRPVSASIAFSANPKANNNSTSSKINTTLGKRIAERKLLATSKEGPSKRRRTEQAGGGDEIDALVAKAEQTSESVLRTVLSEALDKLLASNTSSTAAAIEVFKKDLKDEFGTGNDIFKVYRLLRQPEMAETFLVLEDTERADWLRFELGGGMIHG